MKARFNQNEQHQNSVRSLKSLIIASLLIAFLLNLALFAYNLHQTNQQIDSDAYRLLGVARQVSREALISNDSILATEIITGLIDVSSVQSAEIRKADSSSLAKLVKVPRTSVTRTLTDQIFSSIRIFETTLPKHNGRNGKIILTLDTANYGQSFILKSFAVLLASTLIEALLVAIFILFYPRRINSTNQKPMSAEYDQLTQLPSGTSIRKKLKQLIARSTDKDLFAVLCLGIDDFNDLNIQLNSDNIDQVLIKITDRLRNACPDSTIIGRLGEDQFIILLSQLSEPYQAAETAQQIINKVAQPVNMGQEHHTVNATVGISLFPEDSLEAGHLLQQAEFAMLLAKSRSQNRYQFYIARIDTEIRQKKKLEQDLHKALVNNELSLEYQPQIAYPDSSIVGVEALLRWQHPEKGLISPEHFVPVAESSLDIIPIGDWVLETACHQLHDWHQAGYKQLKMAVNLSAIQLQDKNLANRIYYLLEKYRIPPGRLEIEVTESSIMDENHLSAAQLIKIKETGIILSLDDFGTGYSSLNYLKQFPFDKIKIDKTFIENLPDDKENCVIVEAIIQLGKSFGLSVIAEGIENKEQEQYLLESGCQEGQGFYYSKPVAADVILPILGQSTKGET